jgi:alkane 1-monooxygenase
MKTFVLEHPLNGSFAYRDRKRYLWLASMLYPLLALSGIGLYLLGEHLWWRQLPGLAAG